jgi:threonine synthase
MFEPQFACTNGHPAGLLDWRCNQCGALIEIANFPHFNPNTIRAEEWSLWRYADMLPAAPRITLGEGMTPLVRVNLPDGPIRAKLEYQNPTGSYKDRGAATMVNHLLAHRVGDVVEDSSGNAGAALAAYSAAANMQARIFVPASAPKGKKSLIRMNAELIEIDGPRSAVTDACLEAARTTVYASHVWNPLFIAGQMTAAWEVWEQLGRRVPDAVVCPVGQGLLILGYARGFAVLRDAGLINRVPALYAVQAAASDPVVRAWESGAETVARAGEGPTVADGITTAQPVRGTEILAAVRGSGGMAIRVDDSAILQARDGLARQGLIVEPTSAVPVAALPIVRAHLRSGADIVVPLTGSGLKLVGAPG